MNLKDLINNSSNVHIVSMPKHEEKTFLKDKEAIISAMKEMASKSKSDMSFVQGVVTGLAENFGVDIMSQEFQDAMGMVKGDQDGNKRKLKNFYMTNGVPEKKKRKAVKDKAIAESNVDNIINMAMEQEAEIQDKIKSEKLFEGSSTGTGALYEFFTPEVAIKKMWDLAYHYGFNGGTVLEPACGDGRIIQLAPDKSKVYGFEINKDNFDRAQAKAPAAHLYNESFETAFLQEPRYTSLMKGKTPTWLKGYPFDLVIANPPYGKFIGLYSSFFKWNKQFEIFFIDKCLDITKKGGLLVFIIPSNWLRNGLSYQKEKQAIFKKAELLDAYRLPNSLFAKTNIGTDILVLKRK